MPGRRGFGASLGYGTTSNGSFTSLANITKISGPKFKADAVDVSSHDSPSGYREKLAGLLEAGVITLDLNYDDLAATHQWLTTNLGTAMFFKLTFPTKTSATTAVAAGFVSEVSPEIPHDNKMTCAVQLTLTGAVTITPGT